MSKTSMKFNKTKVIKAAAQPYNAVVARHVDNLRAVIKRMEVSPAKDRFDGLTRMKLERIGS